MKNRYIYKLIMVAAVAAMAIAGCTSYQATKSSSGLYFNPDTVKAGQFDTGKMWTFDYPPTKYFENTYNFAARFNMVQRCPPWSAEACRDCTASFISEDGLVLTNHHCARGALDKVNKPGEDLPDSGFYAPTLSDERKVDGMYADQLVLIKDVTNEVQQAFATGITDEEKIENRNKEIQKIQKEYLRTIQERSSCRIPWSSRSLHFTTAENILSTVTNDIPT